MAIMHNSFASVFVRFLLLLLMLFFSGFGGGGGGFGSEFIAHPV